MASGAYYWTEADLDMYLGSLDIPKQSIMLMADHAMAKSVKVKRFALDRKGFWIDCRVGQREVGDIIGLPAEIDTEVSLAGKSAGEIIAQKRFVHILPDLLRPAFVKSLSELGTMGDANDKLAQMRAKKDLGKPYECIVLFFDELNRGTKDTTQAVFQVVLDREMNGQLLNNACWVFSAINDDTEKYVVSELGPALLSRFHLIPFKPTADEWLAWGKKSGELHPSVLFLLEQQKDLIDPDEKDDLTKPHKNRRGWHMFSTYLFKNFDKFPLAFLRTVGTGFVGHATAEFWKSTTEDMAEMMDKREKAEVTANDKIGRAVANYYRYRNWTKTDLKNAIDSFNPSEMQEFVDRSLQYFAKFTFLSTPVQRLLEDSATVVPAEYMAKLWADLSQTLKEKLKDKNPALYNKLSQI